MSHERRSGIVAIALALIALAAVAGIARLLGYDGPEGGGIFRPLAFTVIGAYLGARLAFVGRGRSR